MSKRKAIPAAILSTVLAMSLLSGCGSKEEGTDVIVIGAGGAGLAAAVQAKDQGANVVVLEKMPMIGGNTNRATGGMNAAGTKAQQTAGIEDSPELFYKDTMKGGHDLNNPELVKTLTEQAKESVAWMESMGADLSDVGRAGGASVNRIHRPAGGAAVGSNIVTTLKKTAEEKKIDIRTNNQVTEVIKDKDGKVSGVKAKDKEGKEYTLKAKAVVMAAGGFGANEEMVISYKPELKGFATTNHPGATGDGIKMAKALGAAFVDMDQIQTHPTVVPEKGVMVTEGVRGNGAILVNKVGKRFINELKTRDVVSKAILEQKDGKAFLFFDKEMRDSLKAIEEYFNMKLVTEADSVEALAEKIGVDAKAMADSVHKYSEEVKAGKDTEFGREDLPKALNQGPFYAIEVTPAVHHTMGGIKINTKAEVMNDNGEVIPGFFACGEVTGGVHGGNRLGGNAIADIITFGKIAGTQASSYISKK